MSDTTPEAIDPGDLVTAVRELTAVVRSLDKKLRTDYLNKHEVKKEGRSRMYKALAFGVVLILIAQVITISTISYCFLGPSGSVHTSCRIMPGYSAAIDLGNERLARFELLITQIQKNQLQINKLELEVAELQKQQKTN